MTVLLPHVLYVDPDAGSWNRVADELDRELSDVTVTSVTSTDEALDVVTDDRKVDCVVSAFELPDGNGLDLLAEVRGEREELPFVPYTDAGSEELASDAISAGVSEYVRADRPDSHRTLARRVREVLDRHRGRGAQTAPAAR